MPTEWAAMMSGIITGFASQSIRESQNQLEGPVGISQLRALQTESNRYLKVILELEGQNEGHLLQSEQLCFDLF